MSHDLRDILGRLSAIEEGLDADQRRVKQLPALFQPRKTSPVLDGPYGKRDAMDGYLVGEESELGTIFEPGIEKTREYQQGHNAAHLAKNPYQEGTPAWTRWLKGRTDRIGPRASQGGFLKNLSMAEGQGRTYEDMVSADKKRLSDYLHDVAQAIEKDADLVDTDSRGRDTVKSVKTIRTDDGHEIKIVGNEDDGFRVSIRDQQGHTRFSNLDEAVMACEMYCARRRQRRSSQDYIEEA
jgi:hypothetical protein